MHMHMHTHATTTFLTRWQYHIHIHIQIQIYKTKQTKRNKQNETRTMSSTTNDDSNGLNLLAAAAANELIPNVFLSREKRWTKKKSKFDKKLIVNYNNESNELWVRKLARLSFQLHTPRGGSYRWCISSRDVTKTFDKIELRAGSRTRYVIPVEKNEHFAIKVQYFNRASSWVDCRMIHSGLPVKSIRQTTSRMLTEKKARMEFIESGFKILQSRDIGKRMMYHLKRCKHRGRVIKLAKLQQTIIRGVDDALLNVKMTNKVVVRAIVKRTLPYVFQSIRKSMQETAQKVWKKKLTWKAIVEFDRFLWDESETINRYLSKLSSFDKKNQQFLLAEYERFTKTKMNRTTSKSKGYFL